MVDLVLLQTVSYIAGALGVCVAAVYYVVMVRINQRNMRITLTNNLIQRLLTDEFMKKITELEYMEWSDYDDFERKYGSDTSPDNYTMRKIVWGTYDSLGMMLMKGLADKEILYNSTLAFSCMGIWIKYKEVLEENRRRYSGADAWAGFEYLANEMMRLKKTRDPSFTTTGPMYVKET